MANNPWGSFGPDIGSMTLQQLQQAGFNPSGPGGAYTNGSIWASPNMVMQGGTPDDSGGEVQKGFNFYGSDPTAHVYGTGPVADQFWRSGQQQPGMTYDPNLGWIMPSNQAEGRYFNQNPGDFVSNYGVPLLMGAATLGTAGWASGLGAAGAEGGAALGAGAVDAGGASLASLGADGGVGNTIAGLQGGSTLGTGFVTPGLDAAGGAFTTGGTASAFGGGLGGAAGTAATGLGTLANGGSTVVNAATSAANGIKIPGTDITIPSNVAAGGIQAILGYLSSQQQTGSLEGIYNQQRADRAPALAAYNNALANPDQFYNSAPAMGSTDAVLRKLSVQGNPAANPGLLSQAAAYNLGGYNSYLAGLAGPAFGGQSTQAQLGTNIANAQGGGLEAIGAGVKTALSSSAMDDFYRAMADKVKATWGGGNTYTR